MDIGEAIQAIKNGLKISRELWKDDCLDPKKTKYIVLASKEQNIWVHMGKNCPGSHWNHEHHDLLATDYFIYEENS